MAQRERRDWQDSFSIVEHFWQTAPARERRNRYPMEPDVGRALEPVDLYKNLSYDSPKTNAIVGILWFVITTLHGYFKGNTLFYISGKYLNEYS